MSAIVVGLPRRLDGRPNDMTAQVQAFAEQLGGRTGLPGGAAGRAAHQPRSREPPCRAATRTGDRARSASTRPRPRSSCKTISTGWRGDAAPLHAADRRWRSWRPSRRAWAGYVLWTRMHQPIAGSRASSSSRFRQGAGSRAIGRRLADAGVVPDAWTFRAALRWSGRGRELQAGEYRFDGRRVAARDRRAAGPRRCPHRRDHLSRRADHRRDGRHLRDARARHGQRLPCGGARRQPIADARPAARDLEGYLFPETYPVSRRVEAATLVRTMVERFKAVYGEVSAGRDARGLSPRQVVTLASLVEKETARPEERPLVAAVYRNRLDIGMGMQADPTVIYALRKTGKYNGNIRRRDLSIDSPYNTYRYPGLPPGPIAAPGPRGARSRARARRRDLPLLRQPQRRLARVRVHAARAQRQRPEVPGPVLQVR